MANKLTHAEFDRQVMEALEGTQSVPRRSQGRPGLIRQLLKARTGTTPTTQTGGATPPQGR